VAEASRSEPFCWRAKVRFSRFSASAVSRTLLLDSAVLRELPSCALLPDVAMLLFLARAIASKRRKYAKPSRAVDDPRPSIEHG
jgi:hypothetical protein